MSATFRLGLFVVATLLILAIGVFLIGSRESMFHSTYEAKASFHNVEGLAEGADVRVGGIHQGTVRRVDLPRQSGQDVTVVMNLATVTRNVVRKDSVAAIRSEGLLGDKYVEVSFGSAGAEQLGNGDTIASEPPFDISDLMRKTNDILDTTQGVVQNAQASARNVNDITSKISSGQGSLGAFIRDPAVYRETNAAVTSLRDNMEALKHNFLLRGFFNRRGYLDADELTKHEVSSFPSGQYTKAFVYDTTRLFAKPDTAKLKNQRALNEAGDFLQEQAFRLAVVATSAGPLGDSGQARELTEARSAAVRKYLADNFRLDDTRIKTLGVGKIVEGKTTATNRQEDVHLGDNQVQILVYRR